MNDSDSNTAAVIGIFAALLLWLMFRKPGTASTRVFSDPAFGSRPPIVLFPGTIFETEIEGYPEEIPTEDAATSFGAGRR